MAPLCFSCPLVCQCINVVHAGWLQGQSNRRSAAQVVGWPLDKWRSGRFPQSRLAGFKLVFPHAIEIAATASSRPPTPAARGWPQLL